ncbi:MAG: phosphopantetheine-binding protein, partial [Polyangiaceae bacterium]
GCSVAFGVDIDGESRLVVVQENDPRASRSTTATGTDADPNQQALDMIRATLGEDYEIQPYAICLAKAGTIPKTSSGKVRRSECRAMYIDGTLEVVASWSMPAAVAPSKEAPRAAQEPARAGAPPNREEIEAWIIASLASKLGTAIDPEDTFASYGVDSATSVELCARLSEWLGRTVMATVVWDYPSIRELVDYLAPSTPIHAAAPPPLAAALDRVAAMTDAEVAAALAERARTQKG